MNIGEVIKLARIKNKMTQEVLARKLETSKNSVVAWEKGHYSPNGEMLIKIGIVLDIVSDLFPDYVKKPQAYNLKAAEGKEKDYISDEQIKKILNDIQQNMKIFIHRHLL